MKKHVERSVTRIVMGLILATTTAGLSAADDFDHVRKLLTSDSYTITWSEPAKYDVNATLEIGIAFGHSGYLQWLWFRPVEDGVDVLAITRESRWAQYHSKWPPDKVSVEVRQARLTADAYWQLLKEIAVVDSARFKPVELDSTSFSSNDFWAQARLSTKEKHDLALQWAGYESSLHEADYAKPKAITQLARDAVKGLEFRDHTLTKQQRAMCSEKFIRDWAHFQKDDSYWFVQETSIRTIGVTGDRTALPLLTQVLKTGDADDRSVYLAINAITRITGKDVRDKPVEEMDVAQVRDKVLKMLQADN